MSECQECGALPPGEKCGEHADRYYFDDPDYGPDDVERMIKGEQLAIDKARERYPRLLPVLSLSAVLAGAVHRPEVIGPDYLPQWRSCPTQQIREDLADMIAHERELLVDTHLWRRLVRHGRTRERVARKARRGWA